MLCEHEYPIAYIYVSDLKLKCILVASNIPSSEWEMVGDTIVTDTWKLTWQPHYNTFVEITNYKALKGLLKSSRIALNRFNSVVHMMQSWTSISIMADISVSCTIIKFEIIITFLPKCSRPLWRRPINIITTRSFRKPSLVSGPYVYHAWSTTFIFFLHPPPSGIDS